MQTVKTCFHCGLDVPENLNLTIHYHDHDEPVCCMGCQAVAQGIIDAGLGQYYEQRTATAEQAQLPPKEIMEQIKLYDLPEVQADFVEIGAGSQREALLMLTGITCSACVWLIEQRLLRLKGIVRVDLNYTTHRARVTWNNDVILLSDILLEVRKCGYQAYPYDAVKLQETQQKERKQAIFRLLVAGLSAMQVMMYAVPTYFFHDIAPIFLWVLHWASMMLTLPVVLYSAVPFYQGAWRDFKNKRVGMDTPIALAILLSFISSLIALIWHVGHGVFFDSISMFVFLLLGGRYLEKMARRKASDATERLVKLVPAFCHRLPEYPNKNEVEQTLVARLQVGDILLIKPGEVIVADGEVIDGESEVNESMLTGESLPIIKTSGSHVTAGTTNIINALFVRVGGVGSQTRLGSIVKLLDSAMAQKPHIAQMADRYASWFVGSLLVLAIGVFLFWSYHTNMEHALWVTVSLLVITCPCALSLATPTALTAGMGNLTSHGILVTHGKALESLAQVSDIVFDKTGTLTEGYLSVTQIQHNPNVIDNWVSIVYALECHSEHPIAQALLRYCDKQPPLPIEKIHNHIGQGISGFYHNQEWRLGRVDYVAKISGSLPDWLNIQQDHTMVVLGNEDGFQVAFYLSDTIKSDAKKTIATLKSIGIKTHILSGDNTANVKYIAQILGIEHQVANATPESKLDYVSQLQAQGRQILMVGDGVNDAPVLARADVSIAMGTGADISREGSDMVMMSQGLEPIAQSVHIARVTRRIIHQNLVWALFYNAIAIPIAVTGHAKPEIAALGMAISSLLVVLNALRLLK